MEASMRASNYLITFAHCLRVSQAKLNFLTTEMAYALQTLLQVRIKSRGKDFTGSRTRVVAFRGGKVIHRVATEVCSSRPGGLLASCHQLKNLAQYIIIISH